MALRSAHWLGPGPSAIFGCLNAAPNVNAGGRLAASWRGVGGATLGTCWRTSTLYAPGPGVMEMRRENRRPSVKAGGRLVTAFVSNAAGAGTLTTVYCRDSGKVGLVRLRMLNFGGDSRPVVCERCCRMRRHVPASLLGE